MDVNKSRVWKLRLSQRAEKIRRAVSGAVVATVLGVKVLFRLALQFIGVASIVYAAMLVAPALGFLVGGMILLAVAYLSDEGSGSNR